MSTAQLSMITPPPSVAAVLGALTEETRIGQVDFSTRLAPEPEPEPTEGLDGYDEVVTLGNDSGADQPPDEPADDEVHAGGDEPTAEIVTLACVPDLSDPEAEDQTTDVATTDQADSEPEPEPEPEPVPEPEATPETMESVVHEIRPASFEERIHAPAPLQPVTAPATAPVAGIDPDERPPTVEEIARLVIERMHDAELAMMRHLDAIEVEAARRSELLTAQAELDAELIRLNARREAHAIVTAARVRAGEQPTVSDEERRLDELTESLSRFADVVDELRPAGTRSVPWGRTP